MWPDEAPDLKNEREKRGVIDEAEASKENPPRKQAITGAALGIKKPADEGGKSPIHDRAPLYKFERTRLRLVMRC